MTLGTGHSMYRGMKQMTVTSKGRKTFSSKSCTTVHADWLLLEGNDARQARRRPRLQLEIDMLEMAELLGATSEQQTDGLVDVSLLLCGIK